MLDITNSTSSTSDDAHWENPPDFIPKVGKCCHKDLPKGHRCHICCCWQRTGCLGNVVQLVCWPLMFLILLPILTLSNLVIWAFVYGCRGGAIGVAKSGTQPYCKMLTDKFLVTKNAGIAAWTLFPFPCPFPVFPFSPMLPPSPSPLPQCQQAPWCA